MSLLVCSLTVLWFVWSSFLFVHWFVLPVLICGTIIGADAVDWLRGRYSLLDPVGLLGLLGLHFFFLAPLLHVHWDQWMGYINPPSDWRPWLGGMAAVNCLGLFIYRLARGRRDVLRPAIPIQPVWQVSWKKFVPIVLAALMVTGALQIWIYSRYGGIFGYITTYMTDPIGSAFRGMGILFTVSEGFPIVALMAFTIYARNSKILRSWFMLSVALMAFFVLLMLFGGLRGGRGNTIFQLFWGFGMLHLVARPMSKKAMFIGILFVLGFMYLYGFYKESGLEGLSALQESGTRAEIERKTGRTFRGALLGDLGRSDVQAFLLYRLWPTPPDYEFGRGRTYVGALALLVPRTLWPERPLTKVKEGTELLYGRGSHKPEDFEASNVYGLAGEVMLNFGVPAVFFGFAVLGFAVKAVRRFMIALDPRDMRLLLVPFLVVLTANLLTADSDNIVFVLVKFGAVPVFVILTGSSRAFAKASLPCRRPPSYSRQATVTGH